MATGSQDESFIINLLKSYKFEWEHATTEAAKTQAAQKADTLRKNAALMGITLDETKWGGNVSLANTPGGINIDWNLLATVGKTWASVNPTDPLTIWKNAVGLGLTTNLAGYEADYADFAIPKPVVPKLTAAPGMTPTVTKTGTVGTVVNPVLPKPIIPLTQVTQPVAGTNTNVVQVGADGKAPKGLAVGTVVRTAGGDYIITAVNPDGTYKSTKVGATPTATTERPPMPTTPPQNGFEWQWNEGNGMWLQTKIQPPAMATVESPEVMNASVNLAYDQGMLDAFLAENPGVDGDPAMWDNATLQRFTNWSDNYIDTKAAEALLAGIRFDATKEPWWPSYVAVFEARDAMTKASLKTALDLKINAINQQSADVKANYEFQIAEIDNALNLANWASGQELAASGVVLAGALSWALTANEATGIAQKFLSTQERTNYLNKLANDITILTADFANQGTLIDQATIAEISAQRMLFLTGNQTQYNETMALVQTLKEKGKALNIAAPATEALTRAGEVKTKRLEDLQTAAWFADLAKQGITITENADGTINWEAGLSQDQIIQRDQILFDNWYKTEGLKLDRASLESSNAFNTFQMWATKEGIKLNWAQFNWQKVVEQWQMDNPTGGTGGGTTDTSNPYMTDEAGFKADMQIANNPNEVGTNNYQQAVLRIGLGSGGLTTTDEAFLLALTGIPAEKANWFGSLMKGLGKTLVLQGGMSGVLDAADEQTVRRLADIVDEKSPVRALELYVAWKYRQLSNTKPSAIAVTDWITAQAYAFGTTLGYSAGDIAAAAKWVIANEKTLRGG